MSESDLEILYSPSRWSKRAGPPEIFQIHWNVCIEHTKISRQEIPNQLDVRYGSKSREKLDIYGTDLPEGAPVFVHIHGGYYTETSVTHSDQGYMAKILYKHKIKSIFIGYELCPTVSLDELFKNINKAVEKCIEYAKEHKSRAIYLSGHSAGAHAVAMLLANFIPNWPQESQNLIKGAFLLSGIFDFTPLVDTTVNDLLKMNVQMAKEFSPMFFNNISNICKIYVVAAEHDSPAFIEQAEKFHKHLSTELKIDSNYVFIKNVDHFNVIEKLVEEDYVLTKILIEVICS